MLLLKRWRWLLAATLFSFLFPVRLTILKVAMLTCGVCFWGFTFYLFFDRRWVRQLCSFAVGLFVAAAVFVCLPGKPIDEALLRESYVRSMLPYKGTVYIWGGGSRIGIDCSGLVERGLIDAEMQQAVVTANPALARHALTLWWNNRSARALGDGYHGETHQVMSPGDLNEANYSKVHLGDLAVMADGTHVLAYIGNKTWIEAFPPFVQTRQAPQQVDEYFNSAVKIMRWAVLTDV